jgi:hypothetical protein
MSARIFVLRPAPEPVIFVHAADAKGRYLVEVEGIPALHGAADRRFGSEVSALAYALDLQDLHGFGVVPL